MFTGLVKEIGKITSVKNIPGGKSITVSANDILLDTKIDDSISVNGVCLTVTGVSNNSFTADAVGATLEKTTLKNIKVNDMVNLEPALRLSDRLGGHIVQGHVNAIGSIKNIIKLGDNYKIIISYPPEIDKYIIKEGSITIDGISLTISGLNGYNLEISVIPHTWNSTILKFKNIGNQVNIETDVLGKYIEKLLTANDKKISEGWLKELGF